MGAWRDISAVSDSVPVGWVPWEGFPRSWPHTVLDTPSPPCGASIPSKTPCPGDPVMAIPSQQACALPLRSASPTLRRTFFGPRPIAPEHFDTVGGQADPQDAPILY